jgi:hypothetical protein
MPKQLTYILCVLTLTALGCSSADFNLADPVSDADSQESGAVDTGTTEVGDTGTVDTGTDTGTVDTGTDTGTVDTGTDTGTVDTGTDTGTVDTGTGDAGSVACTPGASRCTGTQLEQCVGDSTTGTTSWVTKGGVCNYACLDTTPDGGTAKATCSCTASGRFMSVTDTKSPDGFAVKDTKTGITWANSDFKYLSTYGSTQANAASACSGKYGTGGWRVPTKAEWSAIVAQVAGPGPWGTSYKQTSCYAPDADAVLKLPTTYATASTQYWTSDHTPAGLGVAIDVSVGEWVESTDKVMQLRCVHD